MKATKQLPVTTNDGTPYPTKFEKNGFNYHKLMGNHKRALYSQYDKQYDNLKGFFVMQGKQLKPAELKSLNLNTFKP